MVGDIGEKIKNYRIDKSLSLHEFARKVNVTHTTISSIEKGKTKSITLALATEIARVLEVSFTEFFEIDDSLNSQLSRQNDELDKRLEEKDELINALKENNKQLKGYFAMMFVSDMQYALNVEGTDQKRKEEIFAFKSKLYNHYKRLGILYDEEIIDVTRGLEHAYAEFYEWYDELRSK